MDAERITYPQSISVSFAARLNVADVKSGGVLPPAAQRKAEAGVTATPQPYVPGHADDGHPAAARGVRSRTSTSGRRSRAGARRAGGATGPVVERKKRRDVKSVTSLCIYISGIYCGSAAEGLTLREYPRPFAADIFRNIR